jgi:hypothetical protein
MGSLYSKPKLPKPQPIVYAPVVSPAVPSTSGGGVAPASTPAASESDDGGTAEKIASAVRKRSLPETILTSFRGVLSEGDWVPHRKSLLGE